MQEGEPKPKRKYKPKCSAEERRRDMQERLATARKSSRLTGHESLAKIEKLNSLIYYDTAAWLSKSDKKCRVQKVRSLHQAKFLNFRMDQNTCDENLVLANNGRAV